MSEMSRSTVDLHFDHFFVKSDSAEYMNFLRRNALARHASSQESAHPREENGDFKWFGHVVIGPDFKTQHYIGGLHTCGHHQNRYLRDFPNGFCQFDTADSGEH